MLLSITSDNSRLPEAFAANIIKSFLFINVTQTTPKKDERPLVFLADASSQLRVLPNVVLCHRSLSGRYLWGFKVLKPKPVRSPSRRRGGD